MVISNQRIEKRGKLCHFPFHGHALYPKCVAGDPLDSPGKGGFLWAGGGFGWK
jgi:hypothetical protein